MCRCHTSILKSVAPTLDGCFGVFGEHARSPSPPRSSTAPKKSAEAAALQEVHPDLQCGALQSTGVTQEYLMLDRGFGIVGEV